MLMQVTVWYIFTNQKLRIGFLSKERMQFEYCYLELKADKNVA